ncbi:MAG: molybdenum cofactor guanylyltransferase MobA [Methylobacteriaceae bacterium]|nr:molybdenum cofactor guanylyltransferase MobA [Methylobacteriaceae bacterium]
MNDTFGLILAGGQGRRMGGADKALLQLAGLPLAAHAAARLGPQCGALALNANGSAERLSALGLPVVADEIADAGPLAGVLAGLRFARESGYAFLCTLSVDAPFAPLDLVARLHEARRVASAGMAVAASGGRRHHVIALWPLALETELRRALVEEGLRKAETFVDRQSPAIAEWPDAPLDPFFNVNRPEDLARAEEMARSG